MLSISALMVVARNTASEAQAVTGTRALMRKEQAVALVGQSPAATPAAQHSACVTPRAASTAASYDVNVVEPGSRVGSHAKRWREVASTNVPLA